MVLQIGSNPSRSINYYSKVLFIILFSILLINIIVSFFTISITRQQSLDYISNTVNLYLKDTQRKLDAVDHFMIWTVKHDPLIEKIEEAQDMAALPEAMKDFRLRVNDFQYSTGKEYQFFLAFKKENYFFNSSPIQLSYSEYLEIKDIFLSEKMSLNNYESLYTWQSIELNNKFYLYHLLEFENRVFISMIAVDDLLKPLKDINLGKNGSIIMENAEQGYLSDSGKVSSLKMDKFNHFFSSHLVFEEENTSLPFSLHVSVDHFSAFEKVVIAQFTLILASAIISLILFMILLYIRNNVIYPIQKFSENLSGINQNKETIDLKNSSIMELEQANTHFKGLIKEIKDLKVNIYEQEFEKKQIQMDFMKLQIKPHFYLNCLTTIYSMAQMEMYDEIQKMALSTSKYFRFLFQTNQNFVELKKELDHIDDYLAIQKIGHGSAFVFETFREPDIEKAKIPPLVLQTFIENSIKHSVSLDEEIKISLNMNYTEIDNKRFIKFIIKDTGPGFPTDVLEKLQNNKFLTTETGNHIGINNVVQRLRLSYGGEFSIEFSNGIDGGAIIVLIIPYLIFGE